MMKNIMEMEMVIDMTMLTCMEKRRKMGAIMKIVMVTGIEMRRKMNMEMVMRTREKSLAQTKLRINRRVNLKTESKILKILNWTTKEQP